MLVIKNNSSPPAEAVEIRLRDGTHTIVDAEDFPRLSLFKWFLLKSASTKYVVTRKIVKGKVYTIRMHRFILNCPSHMKVHHINHNSLDNRRSNLREITEREHRHFDGWHIFNR